MIPEIEYKTCYLDGRLGRAREILRRLIVEYPDYAAFYADLALVYLRQGEIAKAREAAEKARALMALRSNITPPGGASSDRAALGNAPFDNAASGDGAPSNNVASASGAPSSNAALGNVPPDSAPSKGPSYAAPDILAAIGFVRESIGDYEGAFSLYEEARSGISSTGKRRLWIDCAIGRVGDKLPGRGDSKKHAGSESSPQSQHVRDLQAQHAHNLQAQQAHDLQAQQAHDLQARCAHAAQAHYAQPQLKISYFLDPNLAPDALRLVSEHMDRLIARGHKVYAISRIDKVGNVSAEVIRVPAREELYERAPADSDIVVATSWRTAFDAARVHGAVPFYFVQPSPGLEPNENSKAGGGVGNAIGNAAKGADQASKNLEASFMLPLRLIASSDYVRDVLKKRYSRRADVVPYGVDSDVNAPTDAGSDSNISDSNIQASGELQGANGRPVKILVAGSDEDEWMEGVYAALRLILEHHQNDIEVVRVSPSRRLDFSFHVTTWVENPDSSQLAQAFSNCDIFITGSPEGISSQAALLAAAYGLPIVLCVDGKSGISGGEKGTASRIDSKGVAHAGGLGAEQDAADGNTAPGRYLTAPLSDAQAIARAVETLMTDENLRRKIGSSGREIIRTHTWDQVINQLEGIFQAGVIDAQLSYPSATALGVGPSAGAVTGSDGSASGPSMRRPTLSLCMIVKNEERFLARCLDSVKDVVDEMIIVDTGSTDRTVEIAKSYGAKVYFHEWKNDFAEARNVSLEKATGDWILIMDADEILPPESHVIVEHIVSLGREAIYCARIVNQSKEQKASPQFEHFMNRLFPNKPAIKFQGPLHERVVNSTGPLQIIPVANFIVFHEGYQLNVAIGRKKMERNLLLLEDIVTSNPLDFYYRYNLGGTYYNLGQVRKAIEELTQACKLAIEDPEQPLAKATCASSLIILGTIFFELGDAAKSEMHLQEALKIVPNNPDILFLLGNLKVLERNWSDAAALYKCAADPQGERRFALTHDPGTSGWKSWMQLSRCQAHLGDYSNALASVESAIKTSNPSVWREIVSLCLQIRNELLGERAIGESKGFLGWLEEFVRYYTYNAVTAEPRNSQKNTCTTALDLIKIADEAIEKGDLETGITNYLRLYQLGYGSDSDFLYKFAQVLHKTGNLKAAFNLYKESLNLDPTHLKAIDGLITVVGQMREGLR